MTVEDLRRAIEQKQFELDRWTAAGPLHSMIERKRAELAELAAKAKLQGVAIAPATAVPKVAAPEQTFRLVG